MSLFNNHMRELAHAALKHLERKKYTLALAESCTGGLIAGCLTSVAGSSRVFDRGFVTYSNDSKIQLLTVNPDILLKYGAVSAPVADSMAQNARRLGHCNVGLSVTGIAGPGGGTTGKPVGLVYLGLSVNNVPTIVREERFGTLDRDEIRLKTVETSLVMLSKLA